MNTRDIGLIKLTGTMVSVASVALFSPSPSLSLSLSLSLSCVCMCVSVCACAFGGGVWGSFSFGWLVWCPLKNVKTTHTLQAYVTNPAWPAELTLLYLILFYEDSVVYDVINWLQYRLLRLELVSLAAYVAEDGLVSHHWDERPLGLANFICLSTG